MAYAQHGRLRWAELFEPAIRLAEAASRSAPAAMLQADAHLRRTRRPPPSSTSPTARLWPVGHRLKNPELAEVLGRLARDGSRALHEGEIAQAIVAMVQGHPGNRAG